MQSVVVVAASLIGGAFSDRTGRRKIFVSGAAMAYGLAMFVIALASDFNGFLVGMAIGGLGFGLYMITPAILALGGGYCLLYAVAGACAMFGAVAILPVKGIR